MELPCKVSQKSVVLNQIQTKSSISKTFVRLKVLDYKRGRQSTRQSVLCTIGFENRCCEDLTNKRIAYKRVVNRTAKCEKNNEQV